MGFEGTFFSYFQGFCGDKFGYEEGKIIFDKSEKRLDDMITEADYRGNDYIKWHMDKNMLPVIAIYLTLKELNSVEKALESTDEIMEINRIKAKKKNKRIGNLPFGYSIFKMFCTSIVSKQYPPQGWDIEWIKSDKKEIHFNMKSCIYAEITKKYNCYELCTLFCANDDVILAGYRPSIIFERENTIAKGHDHCDFHFKNGNFSKTK